MEEEIKSFINYISIELNLSNNTISSYKKDLIQLNEFLTSKKIFDLSIFKNQDIEDFCMNLSKNQISGRSIQRKLSAINHFFNFLVDEGVIKSNPIKDISKPKNIKKIPNFLTEDDILRLSEIAEENKTIDGVRNYCILKLLFSSGMRVSEVAKLPLSSIVFLNSKMTEIKSLIRVIGKGNKERSIPINKECIDAILNYLKIRDEFSIKDDNKFLFPSRKGGSISRVYIGLMLKNLARMANINEEKVHPHAFRHSIALKLLNGGMNIRYLQEFLGHKDISTTAIYTNINQKEVSKLVNNFHPLGDFYKKKI